MSPLKSALCDITKCKVHDCLTCTELNHNNLRDHFGVQRLLSSILIRSPDNEQLARSGTNCLENLVVSNGSQFSTDMWQRACRCIRDIFTSTVPSELLTWRPEVHTMGVPTPESTPTHSPTLAPAQGHSFDNVSCKTHPGKNEIYRACPRGKVDNKIY